jgi:hypothetical protein
MNLQLSTICGIILLRGESMNDNAYNLLELGGSANVIVSSICDFETETNSFSKDEVILVLENVNVKLNMTEKNSQAYSKKLNMDYGALHLQSLSIESVPFTKQIYNLLGVEQQEESIIQLEEVNCLKSGMLLLKEYVINTDTIKVLGVKEFDVFSNEDTQTTIIYSDEFIETNIYTVQYFVKSERFVIGLDTFNQSWPYMRIQLELLGNQDKDTVNTYIVVDKVSLHCTPWLNFNNSGVTHCFLYFNVIDCLKQPRLVI